MCKFLPIVENFRQDFNHPIRLNSWLIEHHTFFLLLLKKSSSMMIAKVEGAAEKHPKRDMLSPWVARPLLANFLKETNTTIFRTERTIIQFFQNDAWMGNFHHSWSWKALMKLLFALWKDFNENNSVSDEHQSHKKLHRSALDWCTYQKAIYFSLRWQESELRLVKIYSPQNS